MRRYFSVVSLDTMILEVNYKCVVLPALMVNVVRILFILESIEPKHRLVCFIPDIKLTLMKQVLSLKAETLMYRLKDDIESSSSNVTMKFFVHVHLAALANTNCGKVPTCPPGSRWCIRTATTRRQPQKHAIYYANSHNVSQVARSIVRGK